MHEVGIAEEVIEAVVARVDGARVSRVVLDVGRLSGVLPDAIRYCFDLCAEGTPLEGASLEIVETPGTARCRACDEILQLDRFFGRCACGSSDLEWLSGDELKVTQIDLKSD